MMALEHLILRAKSSPKHIVLPEGHDPRIIAAAVKATNDKLARITLLGDTDTLRPLLRAAGDSQDDIAIIAPTHSDNIESYANTFHTLRQHKGLSLLEARQAVEEPLNFANMMVRKCDADGSVAGAEHITSDVVRSALRIIGVDSNHSFVSSIFIMIMAEHSQNLKNGVIYSDCGLVIDPDETQLAEIASAAADNAKALLDIEPKLALLSFATHQSAKHPHVQKICKTVELLKVKRPDLLVDGPLQFDAAIIPDISARKAPRSNLAGNANIFIFPDLNSGNIAYKITERIGGAKAIGPIFQGLAKPANDLSRGCDIASIYNMIAVTVLQAQSKQMAL